MLLSDRLLQDYPIGSAFWVEFADWKWFHRLSMKAEKIGIFRFQVVEYGRHARTIQILVVPYNEYTSPNRRNNNVR